MRLVLFILLALGTGTALYFGLTAPLVAPQHRAFDTSAGAVAVAQVAGPFDHPWAVAFLPGGVMLVTERGGRLWRLGPDGARAEVTGVPAVKAAGQGGLMDVVAARDFAGTREIFLTYSEPAGGKSRTAVAVARLGDDGERLENLRIIFRQQPAVDATRHYGSRVVEAPDGTLWVTLGERGLISQAQNPISHLGKVVRIARDGSAPRDNPFVGGIALDEIWSFGHRNPQGAALDPATGALWIVDHGAKGGDEINKPEGGRNYGWPVISYGTTYAGTKIGSGTEAKGMEQPVYYWDPSIAPSGMMIYSGRLWPGWQGDIFVGALKLKLISRLDRVGDSITGEERLFKGIYGRVRDVREGPKGAIWFLTDEDEGALYRVTPVK
ncbi:MAG: PQQ-dependent sugar dehydrogenase [Thermohalobaculum sp.]